MTFRLETLLKLRKNQEKEEIKKVAIVNAHLIKQKQNLRFVSELEQKNFLSLDNEIRGNPSSNVLWLYNNFFEGSRYQGQRSKVIISEAEEKLELRRKDLTKAIRQRKTLEFLKEKESESLKKKIFKRELEALDESASNLWKRVRR